MEPMVIDELEALRYHKSDLEEKLTDLQDYRQQLIDHLESLMKLLQAQQSLSNASVNSVNYNGSEYLMGSYASLYCATPKTAFHHHQSTSGDISSAFRRPENYNSMSFDASSSIPTRYLRNDLLGAADSVTNAMSSLLRVLSSDEKLIIWNRCERNESHTSRHHRTTFWDKRIEMKRLQEEEKYLEELRNMRLSSDMDSDQGQEDEWSVDELTKELQFSSGEFDTQNHDYEDRLTSGMNAEGDIDNVF